MMDSALMWVIFGIVVVSILAFDLGVFNRGSKHITIRHALAMTALCITVAMIFGIFVYIEMGTEKALEYFAAYVIEESMSVDNIFVFITIFAYFKIPDEYQHKALFYGIVGAIAFRAIFIFAGAELLHRFHFVMYIFGAILIYTALKTAFGKKERDESKSLLVKLTGKMKSAPELDGDKLFTVKDGVRVATPLFMCILVIELTDLVFAFDSIPACLSITTDMFIVYTSNIFAIMGLRSLYFAVHGAMDSLRYMKYGLSAILAFVGIKMVAGDFLEIGVAVSLAVIVTILAITVAGSMIANRRSKRSAA